MSGSSGKKELMRLCRDINNGYFSPNTLDDIIKMAQLFKLCGKMIDIEESKKEKYERYEKRECINQVYLAHLSLIKYELTNAEKLRCIQELIGTERSVSGGYCLWAKHLGHAFEARDMLSIASSLTKELADGKEKDECLSHIKKIRFSVLIGSTKKYLPIKK